MTHASSGYGNAVRSDVTEDAFFEAMRHFPSGVTVTVTRDRYGQPAGFTASSFCSLSAQPPLVAVCLARAANCYQAFVANDDMAVHVLDVSHVPIALRFASKTADKFVGDDFTAHSDGLPALRDAIARLSCSIVARHEAGDHVILVGRVHQVDIAGGDPAVYFARAFHQLQTIAQRV